LVPLVHLVSTEINQKNETNQTNQINQFFAVLSLQHSLSLPSITDYKYNHFTIACLDFQE
jgi:hypothetical protein